MPVEKIFKVFHEEEKDFADIREMPHLRRFFTRAMVQIYVQKWKNQRGKKSKDKKKTCREAHVEKLKTYILNYPVPLIKRAFEEVAGPVPQYAPAMDVDEFELHTFKHPIHGDLKWISRCPKSSTLVFACLFSTGKIIMIPRKKNIRMRFRLRKKTLSKSFRMESSTAPSITVASWFGTTGSISRKHMMLSHRYVAPRTMKAWFGTSSGRCTTSVRVFHAPSKSRPLVNIQERELAA